MAASKQSFEFFRGGGVAAAAAAIAASGVNRDPSAAPKEPIVEKRDRPLPKRGEMLVQGKTPIRGGVPTLGPPLEVASVSSKKPPPEKPERPPVLPRRNTTLVPAEEETSIESEDDLPKKLEKKKPEEMTPKDIAELQKYVQQLESTVSDLKKKTKSINQSEIPSLVEKPPVISDYNMPIFASGIVQQNNTNTVMHDNNLPISGMIQQSDPNFQHVLKLIKASSVRSIQLHNSISLDSFQLLVDALRTCTSVVVLDLSKSKLDNCGHLLASVFKDNKTIIFANLEDCALNEKALVAIADSLAYNSSLTELNVSLNKVSQKMALAFSKSMAVNKTLSVVDFSYGKIKGETACTLAKSMKGMVRVAIHYNNHLDVAAIVDLLDGNKKLQELNLRSCGLGPAAAKALSEKLKSGTCSLASLNVAKNRFTQASLRESGTLPSLTNSSEPPNTNTGDGMKFFADILASSKSLLKVLNLAGNEIDSAGARILADALKSNSMLTSLVLWDNRLGVEGAACFADVLKNNHTLTHLNLRCNDFGPAGARVFAEGLLSNTTLTSLDLTGNNLGPVGTVNFVSCLEKNQTLKELYLGANYLRTNGSSALADALKINKGLTHLSLELNYIGDRDIKLLIEAAKSSSLTSIDVSWNHIGGYGAKDIGMALKENSNIKTLNLEGNYIGEEGVRVLNELLAESGILSSLHLGHNNIRSLHKQPFSKLI